jgi:hypothetical protein
VLLTISTTHRPATDLGFLLHKNPGRRHIAEFGFGAAHVFYPEASDERCSAAVLVDIDPVSLVRGPGAGRGADPGRAICPGALRERPALRGVVVPLRGPGAAVRNRDERPQQGAPRRGRPGHSARGPAAGGGVPRRGRPGPPPVRAARLRDAGAAASAGPLAGENLSRLRSRGLGHKRSLALREFALGIEALERFASGEPLYRVHECVFGVLALESEPVDPRL